jgi:hypothetical protein
MSTVELSNGDVIENAVELFTTGTKVMRNDFEEVLSAQNVAATLGKCQGENLATAINVLTEKVRVIKVGEKLYLVAKETLEAADDFCSADFDIMTLSDCCQKLNQDDYKKTQLENYMRKEGNWSEEDISSITQDFGKFLNRTSQKLDALGIPKLSNEIEDSLSALIEKHIRKTTNWSEEEISGTLKHLREVAKDEWAKQTARARRSPKCFPPTKLILGRSTSND